MRIKKLFVLGAGLMGAGIAQVCASAGLEVTLCDVSTDVAERALQNIAWSAGKLVEKQRVKGPLEQIMARIAPTDDLALAAGADLCIEAVFEKLDLKQEVFRKLSAVIRRETLPQIDTAKTMSLLRAEAPAMAEEWFNDRTS